jgi:hypothetical protein
LTFGNALIVATVGGAALTFNDALVVAIAGGVGTIIGGTITAIVASHIQTQAISAAATASQAEAKRRLAERRAEAAHRCSDALGEFRQVAYATHASRRTRDALPEADYRERCRGVTFQLKTLSERLADKDLVVKVDDASSAASQLFQSRNPTDYNKLTSDLDAAFDGLAERIRILVERFDAESIA